MKKISTLLMPFYDNISMVPALVLLFLVCQLQYSSSQDLYHGHLISNQTDSIEYMIDHLPKNINTIPWHTTFDYWDFNTLKAPYIRRSVSTIKDESPILFPKSNKIIEFAHNRYEHLSIHKDSVISNGISGVPFFDESKTFFGQYIPYRKYSSIDKINSKEVKNYRLIFHVEKSDLPKNILDQLPYKPDSIRITIEIKENVERGQPCTIALHLQRLQAIPVFRLISQVTILETKKANLTWQNINRLIKAPKILKSETFRSTQFFTDSTSTPLVCVYYTDENSIDKVIYKAPTTYKDLPIAEDFKPGIYFFPNPYSNGQLRVELLIKNPGLYTFRIINLVGTEVKRENIYLDGIKAFDKDLSILSKGTYFLSLEQDKDHVIATKRLFVIKPD